MTAPEAGAAGREAHVTDPDDPRLAPYRTLTDRALRQGAAEATGGDAPHGCFLAEGHYVLERLVAAGAPVLSVLLTERRLAAASAYLAAFDGPRYVVSEDVASAVAGYPVHRGVMGLVARPRPLTVEEVAAGAGLLVYLDGLTDTENVGAIFRTAAALGVDGVIAGPTSADPLYRRCVRVSMGASAVLAWARDHDGEGLARLASTPPGWWRVGLSADGARTLDDLAQRPPPRIVAVVGSEGPGLSENVRRSCDELVRIPLQPGVDSLNVAAAAAIALYPLTSRAREIETEWAATSPSQQH